MVALNSGYIQILIAVTTTEGNADYFVRLLQKVLWAKDNDFVMAMACVPIALYIVVIQLTVCLRGDNSHFHRSFISFVAEHFVLFRFIKFWILKTTAIKPTLLNTGKEISGLGGLSLVAKMSMLQMSKSLTTSHTTQNDEQVLF